MFIAVGFCLYTFVGFLTNYFLLAGQLIASILTLGMETAHLGLVAFTR